MVWWCVVVRGDVWCYAVWFSLASGSWVWWEEDQGEQVVSLLGFGLVNRKVLRNP